MEVPAYQAGEAAIFWRTNDFVSLERERERKSTDAESERIFPIQKNGANILIRQILARFGRNPFRRAGRGWKY